MTEIAAAVLPGQPRDNRFDPRIPLECALSQEGAQTTLTARGEVDLSNVRVFAGHVEEAVERAAGGGPFILDLRRVTYLDGYALRVIERAVQRNNHAVIHASPVARRLLAIVGLGKNLRPNE